MDDLDTTLDMLIGRVLLLGAALGLIVAILGLLMMIAGVPTFRDPFGDPARLVIESQGADPLDLMELGMIILMVTPVAGILALTIGFFWLGRLRFALVSVALLILLAASFAISVS